MKREFRSAKQRGWDKSLELENRTNHRCSGKNKGERELEKQGDRQGLESYGVLAEEIN